MTEPRPSAPASPIARPLPPAPPKPVRPAHAIPGAVYVAVYQWPGDELVKLIVRFAPPHGGDAMAVVCPGGWAYDVRYEAWSLFVGQTVPLDEVTRAADRPFV